MQTSKGVSTNISMNSSLRHQLTRHPPLGAERRDEGDQHEQARIQEQFRGLADTADILHPIGIGEAQIAVEAMADIVAIQQIGVLAFRRESSSPPDWRWWICPSPTGR